MKLFRKNSKGFFPDIPLMYRCICFAWTEWITYLCKLLFCIVPVDVLVNSLILFSGGFFLDAVSLRHEQYSVHNFYQVDI
jgi:hypothetical protein